MERTIPLDPSRCSLPLPPHPCENTHSTSCRLFDDEDEDLDYAPFTPFSTSSAASHPILRKANYSVCTHSSSEPSHSGVLCHHSSDGMSPRGSIFGHPEDVYFRLAPKPTASAQMRIATPLLSPSPSPLVTHDTLTRGLGPATVAEDGFATEIGPRSKQEDNYIARAADKLWAVFDGHRGHASSSFAANFLMDHLTGGAGVHSTPSGGQWTGDQERCQNLADSIAHLEESMKESNVGGSTGTTACVALVCSDGVLRIANVGDSRAVISDRTGCLRLVTEDHKAHVEFEARRLEMVGAAAARDDSLSVTRALGDFDLKAQQLGLCSMVDVYEIRAQPGDVLILASDGVWDVLSAQEAVNIVLEEIQNDDVAGGCAQGAAFSGTPRNGPRCAAQALVRCALDRRTGDNTTVVVARFKW